MKKQKKLIKKKEIIKIKLEKMKKKIFNEKI